MQQRILGKSGLKVSEVGLGCWQLGGDFGPMNETVAHGIIESALECSINFFDTADVYGAGRSEQLLGSNLRSANKNALIATKYGRAAGTYPDGYALADLRDSVRRAQDRLQRDCIDLLQLHCVPQSILAHGAIFDWLRTIQQEGHIRWFGASVETVEEGLLCAEQDDLVSLQVIFNMFRQKLIDELFPVTIEKQIGVIVRLPLASGLLSGKFKADQQFDAGDHRNYNRNGEAFSVGETFAGLPLTKGVELVDALKTSVPGGMSMAQMAMRWILDHEAVSTVIPGASSPEQVRMNASASALPPLDAELHQQLRAFYQQNVASHIRGAY